MSTFLLIDPSLRTIGGHNFEYAWVILEAAERAGYRPVLASQRRFRSLRALPPHWKVLPVLPTDTLDRWLPKSPNERCLARDVEGQLLPSPFDDGFPRSQRIAQGWHTARAGRRLARTSQAYARLFQQIEVHPRDVVFLPTLFPRDFLGLVRYLRAAPESRLLDWHVQFQFNFLDGREPDYARQLTAFDAMRRQFAAALREIPQHSIHFYCCTEEVAAQYNRLGVGHFQVLSYSIGREFSGPAVAGAAPRDAAEGPPKTPRPLRVTCAGGLRREKGKRQLSLLLEQLSPQQMASNGVQLRV